MKKMTFRKLFGGICCAAMAMFAVSCAQGVDDETWTSGVSGVQLESPAADQVSFSYVTDAAGVEQVKVSWPVQLGAGGFLCNVANVNDPGNPVAVVSDLTVDGSSFLFPSAEDTDFAVSIQTLANDRYNNAGAESATEIAFSTKIEGVMIPVSEDLGAFITKYITDNAADLAAKRAADPNFEIAFDLEAGATYTMNEMADIQLQPTRLRGNQAARPIVVVGEQACLTFAAGMKVRNINFDYTTSTKAGALLCSDTQYAELEASKFGYPGSAYYIEKPIVVENCNFKNVTKSFVHSGNNSWSCADIQIRNCMIQFDNGSSTERSSFVDFYGNPGYYQGQNSKWAGFVKCLTVANCTIYNLQKPSKCYFVRYSNVSKASKYYPSEYGFVRFENNTISCPTGKNFGNGVPNQKSGFFMICTGNIFHNTNRVDKLFDSNARSNPASAVMNNSFMMAKFTNSNEGQIGKLEDQATFAAAPTALDLNDSQFGGQNFKASGELSSTIGDPRWL